MSDYTYKIRCSNCKVQYELLNIAFNGKALYICSACENIKLHPSIMHINASPELLANPEKVKLINQMCENAINVRKP